MPFLNSATGDPILTQRRIAQQAERGVPADESLYRDYRNDAGPIVIDQTKIARKVLNPGGEPAQSLTGKRNVSQITFDLGDADPSNIGALMIHGNVHKHYEIVDLGNGAKRWIISLEGTEDFEAYLSHLEDNDILPRFRAKDLIIGGYTMVAGPNANFALTATALVGEYDFFGVPEQTAGGTTALAITSITRVSTTATVTTTAPHGLVTGDVVAITGATQTEYNINAVITVTGASTFTYTVSGTPATPATGAPVYATTGLAVTSITRTLQVATVTTEVAHGLATGDQVIISGAAQTEYNGTFTITVTGASTFTYTVTGSPATPATGTITYSRLNASLPVIARTFSGNWDPDATDSDVYFHLQSYDGVDTWTVRAKVSAAETFSSTFAVKKGLDSAGNPIFARVLDQDGANLGGWADQVRFHLPASGIWRPGDTFMFPKRRADRWVQQLDPERPLSSVALAAFLAAAIGEDLEEIRFEGGMTLTSAWQTSAARPDTPGRQGATTRRSGQLMTTGTLTREITDLRLQKAIHEGVKFPLIFDARADVNISTSAYPYRIAAVMPSCRVFGGMYGTAPGGQNRDEAPQFEAGLPDDPFTYDSVVCSAACTLIIDTDITEADVFGS